MEKAATETVALFIYPANKRSTELYHSSKLFKDKQASISNDSALQLMLARIPNSMQSICLWVSR